MGWPVPCFPKEEPKTGNSWGQRGTIWRNLSAPSCWVFPTSVAMERMRQEGRAAPTGTLGMGDPAHAPELHVPRAGSKASLCCCARRFASGTRVMAQREHPAQGCCCPIGAMPVPPCLGLSILLQKSMISLHGAGSDPQHPSKPVLYLHSHSETQ